MRAKLAIVAGSAILIGMTFQSWGADASTVPKSTRFTPLTVDQLNVYQKPLGEQIMKVSSIGLGGPYSPLLRSPVACHSELRIFVRSKFASSPGLGRAFPY